MGQDLPHVFGYKNYGVRSERYRYIVYEDGSEELYDHEKDKWEWHNLADNPEYAEVKEQMRKGFPPITNQLAHCKGRLTANVRPVAP